MTPKGSSRRSGADPSFAKASEDRVCGFAPISSKKARILILGTAPSIPSLKKSQYYGHPQNAFWWIMAKVLREPFTEDYRQRRRMLIRHDVALWDTIEHCRRRGSSDAAIRDASFRAFDAFFRRHPGIRAVFFNGRSAYDIYRRKAGFREGMEHILLPGTSPLYTLPRQEKLKAWRIVRRYLL